MQSPFKSFETLLEIESKTTYMSLTPHGSDDVPLLLFIVPTNMHGAI